MRSIKAFSLFELILVIFISSLVLISISLITKELIFTQKENEAITMLKLDLNSTKIIIEKNLPQIIDKLKYKDETLYLDGNILLKNVSSFNATKGANYFSIDIVLDEKIKQKWEFRL